MGSSISVGFAADVRHSVTRHRTPPRIFVVPRTGRRNPQDERLDMDAITQICTSGGSCGSARQWQHPLRRLLRYPHGHQTEMARWKEGAVCGAGGTDVHDPQFAATGKRLKNQPNLRRRRAGAVGEHGTKGAPMDQNAPAVRRSVLCLMIGLARVTSNCVLGQDKAMTVSGKITFLRLAHFGVLRLDEALLAAWLDQPEQASIMAVISGGTNDLPMA